jgi:hypothetical protein
MKWTRIGPTAWESGKYRIAAAKIGEKYRYTLFADGVIIKMIRTFDSPEDAKREAERQGVE